MPTAAAAGIVGRGRELAALAAAVEQAFGGAGVVALIGGEAGIGKTSAALEVASLARDRGATVVFGPSYETAGSPAYAPWLAVAAQLVGDARAPIREGVDLSADDARFRLHEAFAGVVRDASAERPLLIVLDDLHWADRASIDLLRHLAPVVAGAAVLVVAAYRDEAVEPGGALQDCLAELARHDVALPVELEPLDVGESHALAEQVYGGPIAADVAAVMHRETGGNPFFVQELARHLREEGRDLSLPDALAATPVPENVRHVVGRRVARLSQPTGRLLSLAAAFAGPFAVAELEALAEIEEEEVLAFLDEALAARLLRPVAEDRYEFAHALVRHALYDALSPSRQARLHRRIADALERVHGGRWSAHAGEIALQYARSAALPGAARGIRFAIAAADAARASYAHRDAAAFLAVAGHLAADAASDRRAALLCELAVAHADALDVDAASATVEEALAELERAGAPPGEVASFLASVTLRLKDAGASRRLLEPLVEHGLAVLGSRRNVTWARLKLVLRPVETRALDRYRYGQWLGLDGEAVAIARASGDEDDYARTLEAALWGDASDLEQLLPLVRSWTRPRARLEGLRTVVQTLLYRLGSFEEARAVCEELLAASERYGSTVGRVHGLSLLAETEAALGNFAEAAAQQAEADGLVSRLGPVHRVRSTGSNVEEYLAEYVGADWAAVADRYEGLATQPEAPSLWLGLNAVSTIALARARAGDAEEAERLLDLVTPVMRERDPGEPGFGMDVANAAAAVWELGATRWARDYRRLAEALIEGGARPDRPPELHAGWMAALEGDAAGARRLFADTRELVARRGQRPLRAIVDFDEALALHRLGEPGSEPLLAEAEKGFRALGMSVWIERSLALARELRNRRNLPDGLTAREAEVVRLVAAGKTNREIAQRLVVSVHTVERHLANVYAKIGARNRAEATAYAFRVGL